MFVLYHISYHTVNPQQKTKNPKIYLGFLVF